MSLKWGSSSVVSTLVLKKRCRDILQFSSWVDTWPLQHSLYARGGRTDTPRSSSGRKSLKKKKKPLSWQMVAPAKVSFKKSEHCHHWNRNGTEGLCSRLGGTGYRNPTNLPQKGWFGPLSQSSHVSSASPVASHSVYSRVWPCRT